MPRTILTDLAERKITGAAGSGASVAITHVALGDGNGAAYEAAFEQTELRRERARVAIDSRSRLSATEWRAKATFGTDTPTFKVREVGFFDGDGDLITVASFTEDESRTVGAFEFLLDHVLSFGRVEEGLVIVDAPDDQAFDFAVVALGEMASQRHHLFQINEAFRKAHGHYPGEV